jgi:ribosomal protein S18 acetylase RimI-like enzyme
MSAAVVDVVSTLDQGTYHAVCSLLPQISTSAEAPTFAELSRLVTSPCTHLLIARSGGDVVGMLTLIVVRIPTGLVSHIEDVVVDERARGLGIGRALAAHALELAREAGVRHVNLTSRPSRAAANQLYQSIGFVPRETNVYRYTLT